jgi:hypothetical protein
MALEALQETGAIWSQVDPNHQFLPHLASHRKGDLLNQVDL